MSLAIPLLALALAGAPGKRDRDPGSEPLFTGFGLIVGASAAGAMSLGITAARLMLEHMQCATREWGPEDPSVAGSNPSDEYYCKTAAYSALVAPHIGANVVALALAPAAGVVRGRYDAWRFRMIGEPRRRHRAFIGIGAALVAVGLLGVTFGAPISLLATDSMERSLAIVQLGASATGLGVGLWIYGATYQKNKPTPCLTLLPQLAPDRIGLGVGSRF